jgi:D-alanyl-D-alanine carboxypeptidase/D-alanyl-D-alanine-endopeptidase (penicillin-binding protein 4)
MTTRSDSYVASIHARCAALSLVLLALSGCASVPARPEQPTPQSPPQTALESALVASADKADIKGIRWGFLAVAEDGSTLIASRVDERFLPASTTKLFATAAAFRFLPDVTKPNPALATTIMLQPGAADGAPNLVLVGAGDFMLRDGPNCVTQCLSTLADQVAATGIRAVNTVIGDARYFPDQRWGRGWSHEDFAYEDAAPAAALIVNENIVEATVSPGPAIGDPVLVQFKDRESVEFVTIDARTGPAAIEGTSGNNLDVERPPQGGDLRLFGTLAVNAKPTTINFPVMDPARAAAFRLVRLLEARGIKVAGPPRSLYRPVSLPPGEGSQSLGDLQSGQTIARLEPRPFIETLTRTNKISSNLGAEIILRHISRIESDGSVSEGIKKIIAMLDEAGVPRTAYDLADGSGMSVYNRVAPRALVGLLNYGAKQSWGDAWRATFPIAGQDGTLGRRFGQSPLKGQLFAKTGTLSGVNALAGYLVAASGKRIIFSIVANDRPWGRRSATVEMDSMLDQLARKN